MIDLTSFENKRFPTGGLWAGKLGAVLRAIVTVAVACTLSGPSEAAADGLVAACDDYVRMVTRCIETRMPESDHASERHELEQIRRFGRSSAGQDAAARMCREAMLQKIRDDEHGCYAEEAARLGIQTPCSLLQRAELEETLVAPLAAGIHEGSRCIYQAGGQPPRTVTLTAHWQDGREQLQAAREGAAIFERSARSTTAQTAAPTETIEGLGDDAFLVVAGYMPMLHVRKGDAAVTIEAFGATREQMVEIARQAIARIDPGSPAR